MVIDNDYGHFWLHVAGKSFINQKLLQDYSNKEIDIRNKMRLIVVLTAATVGAMLHLPPCVQAIINPF